MTNVAMHRLYQHALGPVRVSSPLIYSTGCYITRIWWQNCDARRCFASHVGHCSALSEVERGDRSDSVDGCLQHA